MSTVSLGDWLLVTVLATRIGDDARGLEEVRDLFRGLRRRGEVGLLSRLVDERGRLDWSGRVLEEDGSC